MCINHPQKGMDFQNVFEHSTHFSKTIWKTCRFHPVSFSTLTSKCVPITVFAISLMLTRSGLNSHPSAMFLWNLETIHQVTLALGFCFPLVTSCWVLLWTEYLCPPTKCLCSNPTPQGGSMRRWPFKNWSLVPL